jgi:hypothetical protein
MSYPSPDFPDNIPPFELDSNGDPLVDKNGNTLRNRLTEDEYNRLSPNDKLSVDMSRLMNSLSSADPEAGDKVRFREIIADLRQIDIGGDASRIPATNPIRRWENFERDRARYIDRGGTGFRGRGFVSKSGLDNFIDSKGKIKKLSTSEARDAIKAFAEGSLRSFDNGNGDLFITPGQTPRDERGSGVSGEVRTLDGQDTPARTQSARDNLIDYLSAKGLWTNNAGQNNKGRMYSKWKFNASNFAVFFFTPSKGSDYDTEEELDDDWSEFA